MDIKNLMRSLDDLKKELEKTLNSTNIFEVAGVGEYEIRHSKILAWLLGSGNNGDLKYQILENFIKEIHKNNKENLSYLKDYKTAGKDIRIRTEADNIDILIVDNDEKIVIVIENKINAFERTDGDDGGQLKKYEKTINEKYGEFKKLFLFLTPRRDPVSKKNEKTWICVDYEMIDKAISSVLNKSSSQMSEETKIIIEHYIDLLKTKNIVEDKKLQQLCEEIWDKHERELNIIFKYKKTKLDKLHEMIAAKFKFYDNKKLNIKDDVIEEIYKYVFGKPRKDCVKDGKSAIDLQVQNASSRGFVWIGFFQPSIGEDATGKIAQIYEKMFPKNKIQQSKQIKMIYDHKIQDKTDEELAELANDLCQDISRQIEALKKAYGEIKNQKDVL